MAITGLSDLQAAGERGRQGLYPPVAKIAVNMATCGLATGAAEVYEAIGEAVAANGLPAAVRGVGCLGFCQREPLVDVLLPGRPRVLYAEMTPERAQALVAALAGGRLPAEHALALVTADYSLLDDRWRRHAPDGAPDGAPEGVPLLQELPFFAQQRKVVLRNCGVVDPERIEEYIARGGYFPLHRALREMTPGSVIDAITASGLRGRGGAGFPTGSKWRMAAEAPGDEKYVICNADEGDPGAYMDRSILEGDPHSVLEGMIIGAYAAGAHEGYIYVRNEYPLAIRSLKVAIAQAEERGLLGRDILGSGFDFSLYISPGAGAFVCGEETALIAGLEGGVGEPRPKPPYPVERGLWGRPTVINNVKTWANVPPIVARGPEWFAGIGTEHSKGTMVFSLVGKVRNTGLAEVPMGIPLRRLIFDIGGGIAGRRDFKAVQTGGPSGGCLPASLLDLPVDYEQLAQAGSIMGSGGMVVMDEDTCMVDVARFFLTFTRDESCGKCTSCREGTFRMLQILTAITHGRGRPEDLEALKQLAYVVRETSACGLGRTAANPVLTTLRYFADEYEQHIRYKRCPAMVCQEIIATPCKYNCPVKTDVPAFIARIARGEYAQAFDVIRAPNPFPISCGYICHHPCEDRCRSLETGGEAVAIKALKRFAGDYVARSGFAPGRRAPVPPLEKVAIVGSGPAGLVAAYDLARLGYWPTVFEAGPVVGGNLAAAIPEFRLPSRVLELEINCIRRAEVEIRTNTPVDSNPSLDDLLEQGYSAVLLAVGAHRSRRLGIPGEDGAGVLEGLAFLKAIKRGRRVDLGRRVAVVGGGNAAIDAARTALRAGAREVTILYRRTRAEMPAIRREVEAGLEEGVAILELVAPVRVVHENGRLAGVECLRMELGVYDRTGRRRPEPLPGSEFVHPADSLIVAVGEQPDLGFLGSGHGLPVSERNTILADPETLATARPGIFAAGDCVTGPSTIADSIGAGKLAAAMIHKYLRARPLTGDYAVTPRSPYVPTVERSLEEVEQDRLPMPMAPAAERVRDFRLVELGLTEEMALKEARRCLRCDLR